MHTLFSALLLTLVLVPPALATDGVLEISQTCAVQTGCFAGDPAGYPITITATGSYRLTSNLTLPDADTNGIEIDAAGVALDLGGFSILGPTTCTTNVDSTTCSPSGTGFGIIGAEPFNGIQIRNGVVKGAGSFGLVVASYGVIENVGAFENAGGGIFASQGVRLASCDASRNGGDGIQGVDDVQIIDCTVEFNREWGIQLIGSGGEARSTHARNNFAGGINAGEAAIVSGSTASLNGQDGIQAGNGSTINGNTASRNGRHGVFGGEGITIVDNTSFTNGQDGIQAGDGSTIAGNAVNRNGDDGIVGAGGMTIVDNTSFANGGDGILAFLGSNIQRNSARLNQGVGLRLLNSSVAYGGNVFHGNLTGAVEGSGQNLGGNFCAGLNVIDSTCP